MANLNFTVKADGAGKRIRVNDRIGGVEAFNDFVGPGQSAQVAVDSNDGQTGDIDVSAQMQADSPVVVVQQDYAVAAGEELAVPDV